MKRSNLALIYAVICLFFPAIFIFATTIFGKPDTITQDGMDYGAVYSIILMLLGSVIISIFGSILSFIGYRKNKPDLILYAMILSFAVIIVFISYPILILLPVLLGAFGFFSWKDVKRLTPAQAETSPKEE